MQLIHQVGLQNALADGDLISLPAAPPSLSVRLADDVTLIVRYHSPDAFDFEPTISAASVDRSYQIELIDQAKECKDGLSAANGGE